MKSMAKGANMTATQMIDKNGHDIEVGSEVLVPFPNELSNDTWIRPFVGSVIDADEYDEIISVVDKNGECFDVEPNRVEIV